MARFRTYDRDVVRLAAGKMAATYYAVNGYVDIPDAACETYAEAIEAKTQAGKLAKIAVVLQPSERRKLGLVESPARKTRGPRDGQKTETKTAPVGPGTDDANEPVHADETPAEDAAKPDAAG